jgi:two-component system chemotaxis response regulator CheY
MNVVVFKTLRVLIVDGKRINTKLLSDLLSALGVVRITVATDSTIAMTFLHQKSFDAIFFDDAVGPLSPAAFVTALRKDATIECHQVPCILMSASPDRKQVEIARDSGFNDFIAVPVSINTVKNKLTSVLTAPKQFISSDAFSGPDRRRRDGANGARGAGPAKGNPDRRSPSDSRPPGAPSPASPSPESES